MILHKLIFGNINEAQRDEAEEFIENYISALFHNGQACGEYFTVMQKGSMCAYLNLQGREALSGEYDCKYGNKWLAKIEEIFGDKPTLKVIDDDVPTSDTNWNDAPFLYLFTHMNDWASPICRGDNGEPVPLYLLPGQHEDREKVYFWQREYKNHDSIWMRCGELEIPAYKQLATPVSLLSSTGREICDYIERITGISTYYYLMRHWGRRSGEEHRKCPGCGQDWAQDLNQKTPDKPFYLFDFMCKSCRLISHLSNANDDERHAVIGEWHPRKKEEQ